MKFYVTLAFLDPGEVVETDLITTEHVLERAEAGAAPGAARLPRTSTG